MIEWLRGEPVAILILAGCLAAALGALGSLIGAGLASSVFKYPCGDRPNYQSMIPKRVLRSKKRAAGK